MLTARAWCYWHPQHRQTLTRAFTLRLQNRGPGDEAAPPHSEYQRHLSPSLSPLRPQANPRGPILSRCEMCNSQGWLPSAPGRERSRPKGLGPSGRQGWLEGSPGKARGCGQEAAPKCPPALSRNQESSFGRKGRFRRQLLVPAAPTKVQGLGSISHGTKPRSLSFQRPLPVPGHHCFPAPGGTAAAQMTA